MKPMNHSIIAEDAAAKAAEQDFVFFDIYQFDPGRDAELAELFDAMSALLKGKEIAQSWLLYWGVMGTDNPMIVMAAAAKNAETFYKENAAAWEIWGAEAGKLQQKMFKYVTKQETRTGWAIRDLFYTPKKKGIIKDQLTQFFLSKTEQQREGSILPGG